MPAAQQNRAEFIAFAEMLEARDINGKCLQLGLGTAGASHLLFQQLFKEVWTVDGSIENVANLLSRFPETKHILLGNTRDEDLPWYLSERGPFDLLFVDAGHSYDDVRWDCLDYMPLVRSGGIVAFHDAVQRGPGIEVYLFLEWARKFGIEFNIIGDELGIAWTIKG